MSDPTRILRAAEPPSGGGGGPSRQRPGSVTLRSGSAATSDAELLDPANQSLADALRITLRLVQAYAQRGGIIYNAGKLGAR